MHRGGVSLDPRCRGLTLVETVVALSVLAIAALASVQLTLALRRQAAEAASMRAASRRLEALHERITSLPASELPTLHPDGSTLPLPHPDPTVPDDVALPQERARIFYEIPSADPLVVSIWYEWRDDRNALRRQIVRTVMAR